MCVCEVPMFYNLQFLNKKDFMKREKPKNKQTTKHQPNFNTDFLASKGGPISCT